MCGLYLIYYRGLDHSILQCTDVCLGLNTLQSLHGKLLSQDCGRSNLNQEMGSSRGGGKQSWLTRCPWGQPQTRKPLRIAAIAGIAERALRPVQTGSSFCSLQRSGGTDAEEPQQYRKWAAVATQDAAIPQLLCPQCQNTVHGGLQRCFLKQFYP